MVSDESDSNGTNSAIDEYSIALKKHTDGNIYAKDATEEINDDNESVTLINKEEEIETMQEVDNIINMYPEEANCEGLRIYPEEANDEDLRSAESRPKRQNAGTGIDRLVMSFDGNNYKSGTQFFMSKQDLKDETQYLMKLETNIMFT